MTDIVGKLWGFCHTLRHDGIDWLWGQASVIRSLLIRKGCFSLLRRYKLYSILNEPPFC